MPKFDEKGKPVTQEHYIRPKNAEKLLKIAGEIKQTVYINGACGFGKTSLVADFLSRRRYEYYTAADMESMERGLCVFEGKNVSVKEGIVVIDDLQLMETYEVREKVFEKIRILSDKQQIWLILISRAPLPRWLKLLYVQDGFMLIGENELRLTKQETDLFFEKWKIELSLEIMKQLYMQADGYPLILRCAAMRFQSIYHETKHGKPMLLLEQEKLNQGMNDMFDYLDIHVYDQWNFELQEFLMDISIVDSFNLSMAQIITKRDDAGVLILQAQETGSFLEELIKNGTVWYKLRDIMQLSMKRRLKLRTTSKHIEGLYNSAGTCYELSGDMIEALSMYEEIGNEEGISRLLIANARKYAGSGNYWEFRKYYMKLPEKVILTSPELMAGMSLLQSILMNDEESERWYQELYNYMKKQSGSAKKAASERLMYLDIGLPHRGTLTMTDIIKNAGVFLSGKSVLPEMSLTNNQPSIMNGGKDFCEWSKNDKELAKTIGKPAELLLGKFGKGLINLALAESFFEKGMDNYEVSAYANRGRFQAESGGKLEQIFVAVGILSQLAFLNDRSIDAFDMLESFRITAENDAPHILNGIDTLKTRFCLYTGNYGDAVQWLEKAPDEDKEFCTLERYRYMTKVRVYLYMGKRDKALSLLQRMEAYSEKRQRTYIHIEVNILNAIVKQRMGKADWKDNLQKAITEAQEYHFVRIFSREGAALWKLFKAVDFEWKDNRYKEQVLLECEKMAALYPMYLNERTDDMMLSDMEITILKLMEKGLYIIDIAKKLEISVSGVKYHNAEIYKKLGVKGKTEAVIEAKNRKLI